MPDPEGKITAGAANVAAPGPTPVAPDFGASVPISGAPPSGIQPAPPQPPTQHPTFFRRLLFSLGQGLIEGTKVGLQAQMSPQGPSQAANLAITAPQRQREQMTTNQLNDMTVAMTQLKLRLMQTMVLQESEGVQESAYNIGRDTLKDFISKGRVDVLGTGDLKAMHDEFARRQADFAASGQKGVLPLQIMPAPGSSAKDPQYSLVMMDRGKLQEAIPGETWGAEEFSTDDQEQKDFKAAGIGEFKYAGAPAGADQQKALNQKAELHKNWWTKAANQLGQWRRTQEQQKGALERTKEQQKGAGERARLSADVRLKVAQLNNATRRATALLASNDRDTIAAAKVVLDAGKKLSDIQGKESDWKDWLGLSTNTKKATVQARAALDDAVSRMEAVAKKGKPRAAETPKKITPEIAKQYLLKAGGDKAKAMQMARDDKYE